MPLPRIEDYALIGDLETAALVGCDGSIDWLCWPRFDSGACFAALLGGPENGRWLMAPQGEIRETSRRYRTDTLILETRFATESGEVCVVDFMPPRGDCSDIVRIVRGLSGTVRMRMELRLRFDYGHVIPWVSRLDDGTLRAIAGPDLAVLRTPVELRGEDMATIAEFDVAADEAIPFVLTYRSSHLDLPRPIDTGAALADTEKFWTEWSGRYRPEIGEGGTQFPAHWAEAAKRSLITLKALTYEPSGGIVAAATTSLPEWPGGTRNWDYRFCWLRDGAITLFALMTSGYYDEAKSWRDWLIRAMAGSVDQMQIMYGLSGERRLMEWEADWLPGFAGSKPVRIGNAASDQIQLDVYGEVMGVLYMARVGGMEESEQAWSIQKSMLERLETIWRQPDSGLWEVRGPPQHFTSSKVMCWVAFDRCIKSAEQFRLDDCPLDHWKTVRDEIMADVLAHGFDARRNTFTQAYGSAGLDASLLLIPTLGFLPADDPRVVGTVEAIERTLLRDGFVLRYDTGLDGVDGLPPGEGAFLACSFWLGNALILIGRLDDARTLFERLLTLRNDVGLLAEEYDGANARQLGNFPQAFSHVALVDFAHKLAAAVSGRPNPQERMLTG